MAQSVKTAAPATGILPAQEISRDVLLEKYAKGSETTCAKCGPRGDGARGRRTRGRAFAGRPVSSKRKERGFIAAGRINSAAGTSLTATLINCFVQPVGDSITETIDGKPGIYTALAEAAETNAPRRRRGLRLLLIRPSGAWCAAPPRARAAVSYMRVFDRSCETVESAGARRGAQMGVLRCDHPDIEAFIHAKDEGDLANFNVSVA